MNKAILFLLVFLTVVATVSVSANIAQARGRYGSTRIGGYTSTGKGSHYIGGYVRSCRGWGCY